MKYKIKLNLFESKYLLSEGILNYATDITDLGDEVFAGEEESITPNPGFFKIEEENNPENLEEKRFYIIYGSEEFYVRDESGNPKYFKNYDEAYDFLESLRKDYVYKKDYNANADMDRIYLNFEVNGEDENKGTCVIRLYQLGTDRDLTFEKLMSLSDYIYKEFPKQKKYLYKFKSRRPNEEKENELKKYFVDECGYTITIDEKKKIII